MGKFLFVLSNLVSLFCGAIIFMSLTDNRPVQVPPKKEETRQTSAAAAQTTLPSVASTRDLEGRRDRFEIYVSELGVLKRQPVVGGVENNCPSYIPVVPTSGYPYMTVKCGERESWPEYIIMDRSQPRKIDSFTLEISPPLGITLGGRMNFAAREATTEEIRLAVTKDKKRYDCLRGVDMGVNCSQ